MRPSTCPPALDDLLQGFEAPAVIIDGDYRIVAANHAYRRRYAAAELPDGTRCYQASHHYDRPCDQAGETCPLKACRDSGRPQRVLHQHYSPEGEIHVDVSLRPVTNEQGGAPYYLEVMRESHMAATRAGQDKALIGRSPAFSAMLALAERVAPALTPVLLLGETGTGKELLAHAIHQGSPRAGGPFVPVECAGLSETLFESELFGHEKGAFTGAHARKPGLVEAARGGTLFLDEVGDIPLSQQVKLLRLLETNCFRRVGGVDSIEADFRLVLATHRDLGELVAQGRFRSDLYYRISAFPIPLPALRERREDLPMLVSALLQRLAPQGQRRLSPEALRRLGDYAFPGNIRELRNILERAILLSDSELIEAGHLPAGVCHAGGPHGPAPCMTGDGIIPLVEAERRYLAWALARHQGDRRELAERLGMSERTFYRKVRALLNDPAAPEG